MLTALRWIFAMAAFALKGDEREAVKRLTDDDAGKVDLRPVDATFGELAKLPAPSMAWLRPFTRYPAELKTYRVKALLMSVRKEDDGDLHLLLVEPDTGLPLLAESPDPATCAGSRVLSQLEAVRKAVLERVAVVPADVKFPVVLTGVAFFDVPHGVQGEAHNNLELHPVVEIEFV